MNFYLPSKNVKIIKPSKAELSCQCNNTAVHTLVRGEVKGSALAGYDIEIGTPVFGLFPSINKAFGTKIYVAKYNFHKKFIQNNSGIRVRLEQNLFEDALNEKNIILTLNAGKQFAYKEKDTSFIGLNIRFEFSKKKHKKSRFQNRMMDKVIRDIDIVTKQHADEDQIQPVFHKGREVRNLYFLGGDNIDDGNGTSEKPFSKTQWEQILQGHSSKETDLFISLDDLETLTYIRYNDLVKQYSSTQTNVPLEFNNIDLNVVFKIGDYFPEARRKKGLIVSILSSVIKIDKSDTKFNKTKNYYKYQYQQKIIPNKDNILIPVQHLLSSLKLDNIYIDNRYSHSIKSLLPSIKPNNVYIDNRASSKSYTSLLDMMYNLMDSN